MHKTSCIILTCGFAVIDPSCSFMWIRSDSGRLVRKSYITMSWGFDPEAFKAHMKEELYVENRLLMRERMGEMAKMFK